MIRSSWCIVKINDTWNFLGIAESRYVENFIDARLFLQFANESKGNKTIIANRDYHGVSVPFRFARLLIRTWEKLTCSDESMLNERVRRNINNYVYFPCSSEHIVPRVTKFGEV